MSAARTMISLVPRLRVFVASFALLKAVRKKPHRIQERRDLASTLSSAGLRRSIS